MKKNFLDLPPELRNRIYELCLHHDRANGNRANLALLRVCKQISNEARALLIFSVQVTCSNSSTPLLITGDICATLIEGDNDATHQLFPEQLRRVGQVEVRLMVLEGSRDSLTAWRRLGFLVRVLAGFLAKGEVEGIKQNSAFRQNIRIEMLSKAGAKLGEENFGYECARIIKPLRGLREKADVTLEGFGRDVVRYFEKPRADGSKGDGRQ